MFNANNLSLTAVFGTYYKVGAYQREYEWGEEQIAALCSDLIAAFRQGGSKGQEYFLGPIVTVSDNDANQIIDGQQRLTTLMLMFIHLKKLVSQNSAYETKLHHLIHHPSSSGEVFAVNVPKRNKVIKMITEIDAQDKKDYSEMHNIANSISEENLIEAYKSIQELLNDVKKDTFNQNQLIKFIDWVCKKVRIVEIVVESQDMAIGIFESMNDRGINLTPSQLLKSYLVSKVESERKIESIDSYWQKEIYRLRKQHEDGDEAFFKNWLRAKYAAEPGSGKGDFDRIGGQYHSWVRENSQKIGLITQDDVVSFVTEDFYIFAEHYHFLHEASKASMTNDDISGNRSFDYVYCNRIVGFDRQYACILSPILLNDSNDERNKKISMVSGALSIFIANRLANGDPIAASSVKGDMYKLTFDIRNSNIEKLQRELLKFIQDQTYDMEPISEFQTKKATEARFLLAQMIAWIEGEMNEAGTIRHYLNAKKYDVEHILPKQFDPDDPQWNGDKHAFESDRQALGAKLLIDKSRNRGIGDLEYQKKVVCYGSENNWLTKSLSLTGTKQFKNFKEREGLSGFGPFSEFGGEELRKRRKLMSQLAKKVWDPKRVLGLARD